MDFLKEMIPIWVSRKNAEGEISQMKVGGWMFMLIWLLILLNFFLWSGYGIYEWFRIVI